jgi:hypothetical protein
MQQYYQERKVENTNKSNIGLRYEVMNDSSNEYLLKVSYGKLHIFQKNKDEEKDMDASNASTSYDQVE